MMNNNQFDPELRGKALEKPPTSFKDDQDIVRWVRQGLNKLEVVADTADPSYQLACFLAASSVVGPDENRIARMFGLPRLSVALWAKNLRRGGIWQGGFACREMWHDEECGLFSFILAMLVAEGLVETCGDDAGEPTYRVLGGLRFWQNN